MTCSRLFILGALVGGGALVSAIPAGFAQPAAAQPAAATPAPAAGQPAPKAAAKAPKAPAGPVAAQGAPQPAKYPYGLAEARVRSAQNQVDLVTAAGKQQAKKDDVVLPGQRLETGNAAMAELGFADGTRVQVGENSQLSVYGAVAATPPGKKPQPFKPGSNTLTKGEVYVIVPPAPAPPAPAAPAPGKKPKKVKVVAAKLPASAVVATPLGKVRVQQGARARVSVLPGGITLVSVYEGNSELQQQGPKAKPVVIAAGSGSKLQDAKTPPVAPAPLPAPPTISGAPTLVFSAGTPAEVGGTYAAAAGAPAPTQWHVQIAQDDQFEQLVRESRVPATETRLFATPLPPGEYVARVSAVNAEGAEGQPSQSVRLKVAKVVLWPGSEGKRAAVQVEGSGLFCSLDGGDAAPMTTPLPLTPAREHTLRCTTVQTGATPEQTAEYKITAAQSGPLVAKVEPGTATWTETEGQRKVRLSLSDASGNPLSGAKVEAEGAGGARAEAVTEVGTTGTYETTVHWPKGQTGQSVNYKINAAETYAAVLPDEQPPASEKPKETARPGSKRVAGEWSLMPLVHVDVLHNVVAIGIGTEIGLRIKLGYGALGFHLRPQYEYYSPDPAFSHVIAVGLPITYRIRKDVDSDWVPYIGVLPQFVADFSALARDGVAIEPGQWKTQFALGGLAGIELRLRRGAVFVEGGYRYVFDRPETTDFASLSGVFANLGYRLNF